MKFQIVYDKPQRIRFRCGAYAFDKEYEGAIYNLVTASPYVNSAQVSSANGGILVNYTKGSRSKIIDLVRAINVKTMNRVQNLEFRRLTAIFMTIFSLLLQSTIFQRCFFLLR